MSGAATLSARGFSVDGNGFTFRKVKRRRVSEDSLHTEAKVKLIAVAAVQEVASKEVEFVPLKTKRRPISTDHVEETVAVSTEADEDIISDKNRRFRGSQDRRRSSLSNRGKRLSALSSNKIVLPHASIEPSEYYKHISPDLPDPVRMKTLLMLCGKKAIRAQVSTSSKLEEIEANIAAKSIQKELLKALMHNRIDVSWYQNSNFAATTPKTTKAHPVNEQNKIVQASLIQEIQRLKTERDCWQNIFQVTREKHTAIIEQGSMPSQTLQSTVIDETLTSDELRLLNIPHIPPVPIDLEAVHIKATYIHHGVYTANRIIEACDRETRTAKHVVSKQVDKALQMTQLDMSGKQLLRSLSQLAPTAR